MALAACLPLPNSSSSLCFHGNQTNGRHSCACTTNCVTAVLTIHWTWKQLPVQLIRQNVENIFHLVVPVDKTAEKMVGVHRISRHRWSSRVITNVVGEVENVIQKVQLGDQSVHSFR